MAQISVRLFNRLFFRNARRFSSSAKVVGGNLFPTTARIICPTIVDFQQKRFARVEGKWPDDDFPDGTKPKLTKKDVDNRVFKAIKTFDRLPKDKELTMETHFTNDLGLDSLDHVEVLMTIEEEFGMEIPDDDYDKLLTVKAIVEYVCLKQDVELHAAT